MVLVDSTIIVAGSTLIGTLGATWLAQRYSAKGAEASRRHDAEQAAEERDAARSEAERAAEREAIAALLDKLQALETSDERDIEKEAPAVESLAYRIDDTELHALTIGYPFGAKRDSEVRARAGYVLRTPKGLRTDDGHLAGERLLTEKREALQRERASDRDQADS